MSDLIARFGPLIAPLILSFLAGFVVGKIAKKALRKTILVTVVVLALLSVLGLVNIDLSTLQGWAESGSAWLKDNLEGPAMYLAALLPSATAAIAGATIGFKGGRDEDKGRDSGPAPVKRRR